MVTAVEWSAVTDAAGHMHGFPVALTMARRPPSPERQRSPSW